MGEKLSPYYFNGSYYSPPVETWSMIAFFAGDGEKPRTIP